MPSESLPYIELRQWDKALILTKMPAGLLTRISYASIRGVDKEEGAVQRILSTRRINNVRDFTLARGDYPNSIVLNWINPDHAIEISESIIKIPDVPKSAQLIDGQHRVAGLRAAIEQDETITALEIPVAIYIGLDTRQCANIFLAINTEQKPVPRSLVYDLYGLADDQIANAAAVRARDIAVALNEEQESPYYELIKLPGSPRKRGGIALSTAVSAIRPLVEDKGDFEQIGVTALETQKRIVLNYLTSLRNKYGVHWHDNSNAFMFASGFTGAMDFLRLKLIPYCNREKSFTTRTIDAVIAMDASTRIHQDEVKGKGGKDAPKIIFDRLVEIFDPQSETNTEFEV